MFCEELTDITEEVSQEILNKQVKLGVLNSDLMDYRNMLRESRVQAKDGTELLSEWGGEWKEWMMKKSWVQKVRNC